MFKHVAAAVLFKSNVKAATCTILFSLSPDKGDGMLVLSVRLSVRPTHIRSDPYLRSG